VGWIIWPSQREQVGVRDSPAAERIFYGDGNLFEFAAAYAYHLAESQAYFDGNKRTAVQAALDFLEINGVDTSPLPELATYEAMIQVANDELDRRGLAVFFREILKPNA
jgi:death-on-curing protein